MSAAALCLALVALHGGDISPERLCAASAAIIAMADGEDPATIASIGIGESGLDPWKVGAIGDCSTMQVVWSRDRARQDRRCRRILGDHHAAIRAGVQKIRDARAYCRGRAFRQLPAEACWLAGFQAGPKGVRALARGERWPLVRQGPVLRRAARLRRAIERQGAGA